MHTASYTLHTYAANDLPFVSYHGLYFTPDAGYALMSMIAFIFLLFGFWCGRNCTSKTWSKMCCKCCKKLCAENTNEMQPINNRKRYFNNYQTYNQLSNDGNADEKQQKKHLKSKQFEFANLSIRYPMSPFHIQPQVQNTYASNDSPTERTAHFETPVAMDSVHISPDMDDNTTVVAENVNIEDKSANIDMEIKLNFKSKSEPRKKSRKRKRYKKKKSKNSYHMREFREDSFDVAMHEQLTLNNNSNAHHRSSIHYISPSPNSAKDDIDIIMNGNAHAQKKRNSHHLRLLKSSKRALSDPRSINKQIIVLPNYRTPTSNSMQPTAILSPPSIHSASEFQSLLRSSGN